MLSGRSRRWIILTLLLVFVVVVLLEWLLPRPRRLNDGANHNRGQQSVDLFALTKEPSNSKLRQLNIPATSEIKPRKIDTPEPCEVFGIVQDIDGARISNASIEILVTPKYGPYSNQWIETGVFTDSYGYYELPPQERCPMRMAAVVRNELRGEEFGPPVTGTSIAPYYFRRDITVKKAKLFNGTVVNAKMEPIENAVVCGSPEIYLESDFSIEASSRLWSYSTVTDKNGYFELGTIPTGVWRIIIESDEGQPVDKYIENNENERNIDDGIFIVPSPSCWSIVVTNSSGEYIETAEVTITPGVYGESASCSTLSGNSKFTYFTDSDGLVNVCDRKPGDALIEAKKTGYTREIFRNRTGQHPVVLQLESADTVIGNISNYNNEMCPCLATIRSAGTVLQYGMKLEMGNDGNFIIDGVPMETTNRREITITTTMGYWRGMLPMKEEDMRPEVIDIAQLEIEIDQKPILSGPWIPLGK